VSASTKPAWLTRWWPQRVRTRLTFLYAGLFLAAGSVLLGLTYGLVASRLPATAAQPRPSAAETAKLLQLCNQTPPPVVGPKSKAASKPNPKTSYDCKRAFAAGAQSASQSQRARALDDLLLFSLLGLGVMTVASGVLRPVRAMTETARRASEQHLGERLALTGPQDELKELADTFDDLLERLDGAFASQKRFVANASHELRTPLTVMRTSIDVTLAKQSPSPQQLEAMAQKVRRAVDRAESTIDALLTLAVSDQGRVGHDPVDLATAAEDAIDAVAPAISELDLHLQVALESAATVGDHLLLERMIANLVENAVDHNNPGGWISVRTGANNGSAYFEVSNSGPFVPEDALAGIFEPFARSEARMNSDHGVGLGLSIVNSIGIAHDASVVVRSRPAGGLDVSVVLAARS
jgi:signal transduction histidine kinase